MAHYGRRRNLTQFQLSGANKAKLVICDHTIDITYLRLLTSWLYLVAIIDWYSRYVVSWELHDSLEVEFVLTAVKRAFSQGRPEIFNSDQGSQFTSQSYIGLLEGAGVRISMDSKGRAFDNIFTERLWRTVKYEDIYIRHYRK